MINYDISDQISKDILEIFNKWFEEQPKKEVKNKKDSAKDLKAENEKLKKELNDYKFKFDQIKAFFKGIIGE